MNHIALSRDVAAGRFGPDVRAWLQAGFATYVVGAAPLELALKLTGGCRIAARNSALLRAASLLDGGRDLSAWELAGELCDRLTRFESDALVLIRRGEPIHLGPFDDALLEAFQTGAKPMRSRRRLFELLTNAP